MGEARVARVGGAKGASGRGMCVSQSLLYLTVLHT